MATDVILHQSHKKQLTPIIGKRKKMKQGKGAVPKKEYELTKNGNILVYLRQGYVWEKTVLRTNEKSGFLLADVTLVKGRTVKTFVGINAMDTPAGRKALKDIATADEKAPIAKKSKLSIAAIKAKHKAKLRAKSALANNQQASGVDKSSSAKNAGLGKGQGKKDHK